MSKFFSKTQPSVMDVLSSLIKQRSTSAEHPLLILGIASLALSSSAGPAESAHRLWMDVFHLNISTIALVHLINTCVDLLTSGLMGYISDRVLTWLGSRVPLLLFGVLLKLLLLWMHIHPPGWEGTMQIADVNALDEIPRHIRQDVQGDATEYDNCTALKVRIEQNIALGKLPPAFPPLSSLTNALHRQLHAIAVNDQDAQAWHFALTYIAFNICGHFLVMRSFQTLTLEMASSPAIQIAISVSVSLGQILGLLVTSAASIIVSSIYATNILRQTEVLLSIAVGTFPAVLPLLLISSSRKASINTQNRSDLAGSVRELSDNAVIRVTVLLIVVSTISHVIPDAFKGHAVKNVLQAENTAFVSSIVGICVEATALLTNFATNALVKRRVALINILMFSCAVALMYAAYVLPLLVHVDLKHFMITQILATSTRGIHHMYKRQMLTDAIFYDAMLHGEMRGGLIGAIEGAVGEMLRMSVSAVPAVLLSRSGYINNGGCQCGCGAPCPAHRRWICPGDIGYACTTSLTRTNLPFFGDPLRSAPCTWQPSFILKAIRYSVFLINPLVNAIAAILILFCYPVSDRIRSEIGEQTTALENGERAFDPLTLEEVRRKRPSIFSVFAQAELLVLNQKRGVTLLTRRFIFEIVLASLLTWFAVSYLIRSFKRHESVLPVVVLIGLSVFWITIPLLKLLFLAKHVMEFRWHALSSHLVKGLVVGSPQPRRSQQLASRMIASLSAWRNRAKALQAAR